MKGNFHLSQGEEEGKDNDWMEELVMRAAGAAVAAPSDVQLSESPAVSEEERLLAAANDDNACQLWSQAPEEGRADRQQLLGAYSKNVSRNTTLSSFGMECSTAVMSVRSPGNLESDLSDCIAEWKAGSARSRAVSARKSSSQMSAWSWAVWAESGPRGVCRRARLCSEAATCTHAMHMPCT